MGINWTTSGSGSKQAKTATQTGLSMNVKKISKYIFEADMIDGFKWILDRYMDWGRRAETGLLQPPCAGQGRARRGNAR